ncbi:T9SS type A sorting domain-containing protein [Fibrella aquatica]|uniref:T9SS type A sorting domain-containing protein n=1 Tax=Fibrella aquatica TaxID=3242487 RepID=UPI0035208342
MKLAAYIGLFSLFLQPVRAQTTLFQQDFSAGSPLSQYISGSPNANQFNGITGPSVAIVNGALQFDRPNNSSTGHFARSTDFSPTPGSLYMQMDFEVVSATTTAGNSALLFYVGNGFSNGPGNPSNADIYARFGINFTGNGYEFSVRHIPVGGAGSFNSATFTGKQTLTLVLNNTGYTVTYLQPGGGLQTLANDTYDLWVGNTEVVNGLPVITPNQTMTDFKLRIDDDVYAAVFQFDNFLIRDITGILPLSASDFQAIRNGSQVDLSWSSANQSANFFGIERSGDAQAFSEIGQVRTQPNQTIYRFTDDFPPAGTSYYRLKQTHADGAVSVSKPLAVDVPDNVPDFTVLDNPGDGSSIVVRPRNLPGATYLITTLSGQVIRYQQRETPDGQVTLLLQHPLPSGVYLLTAQTETRRLTRKVLVR